jgi:hypothetical protein
MNGNWDQEIVRLLSNWALWVSGSNRRKASPYPAYNLAPPSARYINMIPVLNGDAEDVDHVIGTLDARYQKPLQMHYCWPGRSDRSKAAACTCCLNTYKLRLDRAHRLFIQGWYGRQFVRSRVGLDTVDTFQ